jgi:hypothetical protein
MLSKDMKVSYKDCIYSKDDDSYKLKRMVTKIFDDSNHDIGREYIKTERNFIEDVKNSKIKVNVNISNHYTQSNTRVTTFLSIYDF